MKNYLEAFDVPEIINAAGTLTIYGGCRMWPNAAFEMAKAAQSFVDLELLLKKSGEYIAKLLNVEAALVTSGASPAIIQSVAACMAGTDPYLRNRLPATPPERKEVIIQRIHRNPYDNAVPTTGAKFVEIGDGIKTNPWELENSINERTAAIFYALHAEMMEASLSLNSVLEIAHKYHIPVIVDAAAEIPPKKNLWELAQRGADLVVFSGGKDIRGPQTSGLLVGRRDLIEAADFNGAPHYGVGRPMKASKEIIVGFVAALKCYLDEDEEARFAYWHETQHYLLTMLRSMPNLIAEPFTPTQMGIHPICVPKISIRFREGSSISTSQLAKELRYGDPSIIVDQRKDYLIINLQVLALDEPKRIVERIGNILHGS